MEKRKYTLKKRAENQEETRARIVEATMALHEELGPRNTTVSAVADRAGVQRLTVYRYFPDEMALFQACTGAWLARHPPPPPPEPPMAPGDVAPALQGLYGYYAGTRGMWAVSYRDVALVPALQAPMQQVDDYLQAYATALSTAWKPARARRTDLAAAARVAVQFGTWQLLQEQGLDDAAKALVMTRSLAAQAEGADHVTDPTKQTRAR